MSDTLTMHNWLGDQARYLQQAPGADLSVLFLRDLYARDLSEDGRALCLRLVLGMLAGTTDLAPADAAPLAQRVLFGYVRRALWFSYLWLGALTPTGQDEPILTETALAALISIETQDPIVAAPAGRLTSLAAMFAGLSWRASTVNLGVDMRTA